MKAETLIDPIQCMRGIGFEKPKFESGDQYGSIKRAACYVAPSMAALSPDKALEEALTTTNEWLLESFDVAQDGRVANAMQLLSSTIAGYATEVFPDSAFTVPEDSLFDNSTLTDFGARIGQAFGRMDFTRVYSANFRAMSKENPDVEFLARNVILGCYHSTLRSETRLAAQAPLYESTQGFTEVPDPDHLIVPIETVLIADPLSPDLIADYLFGSYDLNDPEDYIGGRTITPTAQYEPLKSAVEVKLTQMLDDPEGAVTKDREEIALTTGLRVTPGFVALRASGLEHALNYYRS